jgi:peptidyl-prolyl cis-trans isomerase A (cyclophilin A)
MVKNIDIKKVFYIYFFAFLLAAFSFRAEAKTEIKDSTKSK